MFAYVVRVSGTAQNPPGPQSAANRVYSGVIPSLGRAPTGGQTKILRLKGRSRLDLNLDIYNAFNSDAVLTQQNAFTTAWQLPLSVIQPRFVKFSARWDF